MQMEARVDAAMLALLAQRGRGVSRVRLQELVAAHAMSVRILTRLPHVDANVAAFISLKTECVRSPLTHAALVRLSGLSRETLNAREVAVLRGMDWRLYEGALADAQ